MQDILGDVDIVNIEHQFGGKGKARREERRASRDTRKLDRKAANRADKTANQLLKIDARKSGGNALDKITGSLSGIFGKGAATEPVYDEQMDERGLSIGFTDQAAADAAAKKQQTNTIIIIVVVIVVVAVIALFVMRSKKNKAKKAE